MLAKTLIAILEETYGTFHSVLATGTEPVSPLVLQWNEISAIYASVRGMCRFDESRDVRTRSHACVRASTGGTPDFFGGDLCHWFRRHLETFFLQLR